MPDKFNDFFGLHKREGLGDSSPCGVQGKNTGRGLGTNPVGGMGNEVPQKMTTFLGLKVYFLHKISQ